LKIPSFSSNTFFSEDISSVSLIGSINFCRYKWNPFNADLEMTQVSNNEWRKLIFLEGKDKNFSGKYSLRVVINHNPRKQLKSKALNNRVWDLTYSEFGEIGTNINFEIENDQLVEFIFKRDLLNIECKAVKVETELTPIYSYNSYQLNGFVWDDLNMFEKFNPKVGDRSFKFISDDLWTIDVPLKKNGGIDFRADGVYQFLISADFEEDFGFSSINDGKGSLVKNCGFSSSHGTSMNSGSTIEVTESGMYRFSLHSPQETPKITVKKIDKNEDLSSEKQLSLLNKIESIQLLGSIYESDQFNPQNLDRNMNNINNTAKYEKIVNVKAGEHSVNFAFSSELFLDTMGLGCWLDINNNKDGQKLSGIGWHGKPQEFNTNFMVSSDSDIKFTYDLDNDKFEIEALNSETKLKPLLMIEKLSIVGNFDKPLDAWSTESESNVMNNIGAGRFECFIKLKKDFKYEYKYVANKSNWNLVFADYELDGFGSDFYGNNDNVSNPTLKSLKRDGQLTTHGNPPPLEFIPNSTGYYKFKADIILGSYSVTAIP